MNTKLELGRIAGIPILLDMFFVLILILFATPYFTSGSSQGLSIGFVIIIGLLVSILLHELGHALAARLFAVGVTHIELTGLGGIAHFDRSLPRSALAQTVIHLAGPAANLLLWLGFHELAASPVGNGAPAFVYTMLALSSFNFLLMVFNLLPAFPLDGGRTLEAWITALGGNVWAVRIVGSLGIVVAVLIGLYALPSNLWLILLAVILFIENWQRLQIVGWPTRRR